MNWISILLGKGRNDAESKRFVRQKADELSGLIAGEKWLPIEGYVALVNFSIGCRFPTFNCSKGFPVKGFVNNVTGEVKIFSTELFER